MSNLKTCNIEAGYDWITKKQDQIKNHPAWHGNIPAREAENFVKGKGPFTYILRSGEKERSYFITFVQNDQLIKHQYFSLEYDRKGWYYRNGEVQGPLEAIAEYINELVPIMMHCQAQDCKLLENSSLWKDIEVAN